MTLPRVVYIGASPPHGMEMLQYLLILPCVVEYITAEDIPPKWPLRWEYDLGLNFLGTHKIPAEEVKRPRLGWVNFHPAPLPEFRGRNLCYHAIMDYAEYFGATAHYMDATYDTGNIIEVKRFPITPRQNAGDLHGWAIASCIQLFKEWVPQLLLGRVPSYPQNENRARYYSKEPLPEQVYLGNSYECQLVRALSCPPKHHAYVVIGGRRYKLVPE